MKAEDKTEFSNLLIATMAVYERQITKAVADVYFNALGLHSLDQVREALSRHMQDGEAGKFSPKPADLIRQINLVVQNDGRPGKDEAWSIALCAQDELDTVLVTEEILAAMAVAQPLLEIRDKVAARLAFVEAYERLVVKARRDRDLLVERCRREGKTPPPIWQISLGTDKIRRVHALEEGVRLGRLSQAQAEPHLLRIAQENQPVSRDAIAIAGLLAGPHDGKPLSKEELRGRWQQIRQNVAGADDRRAEKKHAKVLADVDDLNRRKKAQEEAISANSTAVTLGE